MTVNGANGAYGNGDFLPEEEEDKDYKYLIYRPEQVKQKVRFCIINVFQIDSYEVEVEPHTRFREDLHLDDKKLQK